MNTECKVYGYDNTQGKRSCKTVFKKIADGKQIAEPLLVYSHMATNECASEALANLLPAHFFTIVSPCLQIPSRRKDSVIMLCNQRIMFTGFNGQ